MAAGEGHGYAWQHRAVLNRVMTYLWRMQPSVPGLRCVAMLPGRLGSFGSSQTSEGYPVALSSEDWRKPHRDSLVTKSNIPVGFHIYWATWSHAAELWLSSEVWKGLIQRLDRVSPRDQTSPDAS